MSVGQAPARPRIWMRPEIVACWGIALLTSVVFWGVLSNDFIHFDDNSYVTENRFVQAGLTGESIRAAFTESFNGHWHPLTTLSYMIDTALFGRGPAGYHFTNLLLHVVNSLLLFLLLRDVTGAFYRSLAVALLFAIHPLHVEPVAWIASRKDVLSTLFLFAAIYAYVYYARRPSALRMAAVLAAMLLGLFSKAMLVTLPVVLLALDYWPLARYEDAWQRGFHERIQRGIALLREKIPLFTLSFVFAIVTVATQSVSGTMSKLDALPIGARLVNAVQSYGIYIVKMMWPTNLAPFYPHSGAVSLGPEFWFGLFVLVAGALISLWTLRIAPYVAVGFVWYVVTLLPVSGILQAGIQAYADRYTYVPLIGVFAAMVWGADAILRRFPIPERPLFVTGGVLTLVLAVLSWVQVQRWENDERLFTHTLAVTENNFVAHMIVGNVYYERGELDAAIAEYQASLTIAPNDADTCAAMGLALAAKGDTESAMNYYKAALNLNPDHVPARAKLAALLLSQGNLDHAIVQFEQTLARRPDHVVALNGLGLAYAGQHRYADAIDALRRGIAIAPDDPSLHSDLALVLAQEGQRDDAYRHFDEAVRLDPGDPEAHNNLAIILAELGRYDEAVTHFEKALALNPTFEAARTNLARCLQQRDEGQPAENL